MINAERMIVRDGLQFPWSPTLAIAILQLSIWRLIKSELKKNFKTNQTTTNHYSSSQSRFPIFIFAHTIYEQQHESN